MSNVSNERLLFIKANNLEMMFVFFVGTDDYSFGISMKNWTLIGF